MIIKTSKDEFSNYVSDAANFRGDCDLLVIPENKSELIDFIKKSNNEKNHVTIRGGGTGLTGAGVPSRGTVVSTEKLIKIIDIDENEKTVTLEPGVVLNDLQDVLKKRGFFYPPDPTETSCFIGGTIVNNSSGAKSFKYGPTRNFVEELEVILPTGEVLNLKRGSVFAENYQVRFFTYNGREIRLDLPKYNMPNTKNAAGYYTKPDMDLIDLFIGSEGTLGIVSQAKLKINR
ncbi:MAG: FAD-binding oxidoreductase, partial [Bacteroidetes bacterium]